MGASSPKGRPHHRTIDRIALILDRVARSPAGLRLVDLAAELDAPASSAHSLVNGLVATGYLDEHDRRYTLGSAPYLLNRMSNREPVSTVNHKDLERLHHECGLTTVLSISVGGKLFYVDYCATDPRFGYLAENYVDRPLIRTSGGWVLLAGMDERDLWSYIRRLGPQDAESVEDFFVALSGIRQTGLCAAPNQSAAGDGISIAVRERGKTVAAVGIIAQHDVIEARRDDLTALLATEAAGWSLREQTTCPDHPCM